MKKIFFASLMLLALGGISYGQASPSKSNTAQKKETVKPASSVNSVTPSSTNKSRTASAKTKTSTKTKPAAQSSTQPVPASAIRKHKKPRHTAKKTK